MWEPYRQCLWEWDPPPKGSSSKALPLFLVAAHVVSSRAHSCWWSMGQIHAPGAAPEGEPPLTHWPCSGGAHMPLSLATPISSPHLPRACLMAGPGSHTHLPAIKEAGKLSLEFYFGKVGLWNFPWNRRDI